MPLLITARDRAAQSREMGNPQQLAIRGLAGKYAIGRIEMKTDVASGDCEINRTPANHHSYHQSDRRRLVAEQSLTEAVDLGERLCEDRRGSRRAKSGGRHDTWRANGRASAIKEYQFRCVAKNQTGESRRWRESKQAPEQQIPGWWVGHFGVLMGRGLGDFRPTWLAKGSGANAKGKVAETEKRKLKRSDDRWTAYRWPISGGLM